MIRKDASSFRAHVFHNLRPETYTSAMTAACMGAELQFNSQLLTSSLQQKHGVPVTRLA